MDHWRHRSGDGHGNHSSNREHREGALGQERTSDSSAWGARAGMRADGLLEQGRASGWPRYARDNRLRPAAVALPTAPAAAKAAPDRIGAAEADSVLVMARSCWPALRSALGVASAIPPKHSMQTVMRLTATAGRVQLWNWLRYCLESHTEQAVFRR